MAELILSVVKGLVGSVVELLTHIGKDPKEVVVQMIDEHPLVKKIDDDIDRLIEDTYVVPDGSSER